MLAIELGTASSASTLAVSVVVSLVAGGAVFVLTGSLVPFLRRQDIVDQPGERRSHDRPTPRGGGIAVDLVVLIGWCAVIVWMGLSPSRALMLILAFFLLTWVSALDDMRDVSPPVRLATQAGAVLLGLSAIDSSSLTFQGVLPFWLDRVAAAVVWIWFINIFNFMDGIDGITVVEATSVGVGVIAVILLADSPIAPVYLAAVIIGAMAGFAPFNWYPAKVFLGDVGAIPIGFVTGWLLLDLVMAGQWVAALILPLYFVADATWTLAARVLRGERPWEAHREHFYQRATPPGTSHAKTAVKVLVADALLVVLAAASTHITAFIALLGSAAVVTALLLSFRATETSATEDK